jgi:hypothetical protein
MKENIQIITCDECGKTIKCTEKHFTFSVPIDAGAVKDLCWECVKARINHSFTVMKSSKCPTCNGKGKNKESCGYHNDYEWVTCKNCHGKGKVI